MFVLTLKDIWTASIVLSIISGFVSFGLAGKVRTKPNGLWDYVLTYTAVGVPIIVFIGTWAVFFFFIK